MDDDAERSHASSARVVAAVAVAVVAVVGLLVWAHAHSFQSTRPVGDVPADGTRAPTSADPRILDAVGLTQADVGPGAVVSLLDEGDQLSQPTLDSCGLRFASESQREARRQVLATDSSGLAVISTEAVLYHDQAGAAQAMGEVRGSLGRCPSRPVQNQQVGGPSLIWRVHSASTSGWPAAGGIDRVALDMRVGRPGVDSIDTLAVYLRRGRLLVAIYFGDPGGPQMSVAGATTTAGTIGVFQRRVAALPASDVS